ncbi:hypothetical protein EV11_0860 [Prochlorococcus sp. SS52]|nr:hypothetical protein EV04_0635 [Prochlorococcus marinus str. LG]KGG21356.1 hypothetical protein EV08_0764 [Prochlorococcus marinus str. SS2]KGG24312.1 hypothetical protein EV09_0359 [Prochlorococcus marinus str. SS35]KGG33596.1 hypothetical protein EV10_0436 [Prochlorococcus marinus str. SS51]KGG36488.1 hypothetical protein EV11_0860 [Prochlorococcus sp. SS52]
MREQEILTSSSVRPSELKQIKMLLKGAIQFQGKLKQF